MQLIHMHATHLQTTACCMQLTCMQAPKEAKVNPLIDSSRIVNCKASHCINKNYRNKGIHRNDIDYVY